jgi:hypothetical protein
MTLVDLGSFHPAEEIHSPDILVDEKLADHPHSAHHALLTRAGEKLASTADVLGDHLRGDVFQLGPRSSILQKASPLVPFMTHQLNRGISKITCLVDFHKSIFQTIPSLHSEPSFHRGNITRITHIAIAVQMKNKACSLPQNGFRAQENRDYDSVYDGAAKRKNTVSD